MQLTSSLSHPEHFRIRDEGCILATCHKNTSFSISTRLREYRLLFSLNNCTKRLISRGIALYSRRVRDARTFGRPGDFASQGINQSAESIGMDGVVSCSSHSNEQVQLTEKKNTDFFKCNRDLQSAPARSSLIEWINEFGIIWRDDCYQLQLCRSLSH